MHSSQSEALVLIRCGLMNMPRIVLQIVSLLGEGFGVAQSALTKQERADLVCCHSFSFWVGVPYRHGALIGAHRTISGARIYPSFGLHVII